MAALRRLILLASRSPRRLELARKAGWNVRVAPPSEEVEESQPPRAAGESLERFVARLAWAKAEEIGRLMAATMEPQETLVACDTLSEVDGETFGKPKDRTDAARMMLAFSGKSHRVLTGTCVWRPSQGEPILAVTESLLRMEKLSQDSIQTYLSTNRWIGKAGAIGYQDGHAWLVLTAGSSSNVVGLPLETVLQSIEQIEIFSRKKFEVKSTQLRSKTPTPVQFYPAIPSKIPSTEKIEGFRTTDSK